MHTQEANIPSQALTAMVFPVFRSGTIFSDIILWVLFLLITDDVVHDIFLAAVVHERDGIFFQVRDYIRGGGRGREREREILKKLIGPLAHAITEVGKFKVCRVGQQARDSGRSQYCRSRPQAV